MNNQEPAKVPLKSKLAVKYEKYAIDPWCK